MTKQAGFKRRVRARMAKTGESFARLAGLGVPAERVTLICIGEHAGIARFGGLGELTAEQLREFPRTNASARRQPR